MILNWKRMGLDWT